VPPCRSLGHLPHVSSHMPVVLWMAARLPQQEGNFDMKRRDFADLIRSVLQRRSRRPAIGKLI